MEPNIQNKLANLQIDPPQGSWELLSARLVTEYDQAEIQLAQRFQNAALTPPANSWAAIAENLTAEQTVEEATPVTKEPAKLFSIPVRKIAVAAAVLIVFSIAIWLFLPSTADGPPNPNLGTPQANSNPPANSNIPPSGTTSRNIPPAIAQQAPATPRPLPVNQSRSNNQTEENNTTDQASGNPDLDQPDLPATNPSVVRAQDVVAEANIADRPYRDKTGKVVMDMNLLTTPGNQYVTVTAPNGEQTRISRKFLPVLTFANTGADNGQFNSTLKQKIRDLKTQLLQQASFVPSAANFLDIMELKELLQDK